MLAECSGLQKSEFLYKVIDKTHLCLLEIEDPCFHPQEVLMGRNGALAGKTQPRPNCWLNNYARNVTSQNGEDGIIENVLEVIDETII